MANQPKITVVIAVYNNPKWLRLILESLRTQRLRSLSLPEMEIVIADDGSSEENVRQLQAYISGHPEMNILHAWHPDKGWRKNAALNNALRMTSGEYVIFIDGDCIPHPLFIEDHLRLRRRGYVMGGRRIESGESLTRLVESWDALPENWFGKIRRSIVANILADRSASGLAQLRRSIRLPFIFGHAAGLRNQGFLGANFGIYRADLEKVNGFDERYVDPGTGEDSDLDARLGNAGIGHLTAPRYALMVHRHHKRLDFSSPNNAKLFREAREKKITWVPTGLRREDTSQT